MEARIPTLLVARCCTGDGWYALTGAKYGDEFAFIPKFHEMLSAAGRERSSCPITICLYPEELDAFAPDQIGALRRYEEFGVRPKPGKAGGYSAGA